MHTYLHARTHSIMLLCIFLYSFKYIRNINLPSCTRNECPFELCSAKSKFTELLLNKVFEPVPCRNARSYLSKVVATPPELALPPPAFLSIPLKPFLSHFHQRLASFLIVFYYHPTLQMVFHHCLCSSPFSVSYYHSTATEKYHSLRRKKIWIIKSLLSFTFSQHTNSFISQRFFPQDPELGNLWQIVF